MNNDFINNSSVAYMVSLNGTNTVFLGDLAKSGGEQLMADHDLSALSAISSRWPTTDRTAWAMRSTRR